MNTYHKSLGIPKDTKRRAQALIETLKPWHYVITFHALKALQDEAQGDEIKACIRSYILNIDDIFEVSEESGIIIKAGFRIPFNERDICFVLNAQKYVVTIWTNSKEDCHKTLRASQYANV